MSWYRFRTYLKYRLKAKSRHGVHSPFVFEFIEKGLRENPKRSLADNIRAYFYDYLVIEASGTDENKPNLDSLLNTEGKTKLIVMIKNIHLNSSSSAYWVELYSNPKVTLSIDLYNYGLLFFNKEFLVKQHFILKYPA